jgi:hypothetical protein
MNLVFLSGAPEALNIHAGERRYLIERDNGDYEIHTQPRLFIDRFQLVQAPAAAYTQPLWALPGGGRASTAQLLALACRRGWKRPHIVDVTVRYRLDGAKGG